MKIGKNNKYIYNPYIFRSVNCISNKNILELTVMISHIFYT